MRILTGTSGYSYKQWKGSFYPKELKDADFLRYYSSRLRSVEINNTFYRMPTKALFEKWLAEVDPEFTFVLKASQKISHLKRLKPGAEQDLAYLIETATALGPRLGPLLIQLPPNFKKDVPRLAAFLAAVPEGARVAFEFRNESWFDEETYQALRAGRAVLCAADTDDSGEAGPPLVPTADWGYLRLRRSEYTDADLGEWLARVRAQPWREAFVFFKHEDEGKGALFAERFAALASAG